MRREILCEPCAKDTAKAITGSKVIDDYGGIPYYSWESEFFGTKGATLLIDGEVFDDWDGFFHNYEECLEQKDKDLIDDLLHGRRKSGGYIGGGHLPVWFVCLAEEPQT